MHEDFGWAGDERFLDGDNFAKELVENYAMDLQELREAQANESKMPSFKAIHGRAPVAGVDFDPNGDFSQDDYEYFTGTGAYSDDVSPDYDYEDDCPMDGDHESALASCGWGTDEDYGYFGEDW